MHGYSHYTDKQDPEVNAFLKRFADDYSFHIAAQKNQYLLFYYYSLVGLICLEAKEPFLCFIKGAASGRFNLTRAAAYSITIFNCSCGGNSALNSMLSV